MRIENPEEFRKNLRKKIKKIVKKKSTSVNLEKAIFNYSIREARKKKIIRKWENIYFVELYINKFRSIYGHLNPKSSYYNKELYKKLLKKKLKPQEIAFMSHQEMNPEKWKKLIDAKIKRDKNLSEVDLSSATNEFKCFKCKKRVCTYYQLQTRSADEPMTTFVTCLNCGNKWKF